MNETITQEIIRNSLSLISEADEYEKWLTENDFPEPIFTLPIRRDDSSQYHLCLNGVTYLYDLEECFITTGGDEDFTIIVHFFGRLGLGGLTDTIVIRCHN